MESGEQGNHDIFKAYEKIEAFAKKWRKPMQDFCKDNDQRLAVWCLWSQYNRGLQSLKNVSAVGDAYACHIIDRCCLECQISILAIAKNPELGKCYLDYDRDACIRFFKAEGTLDDDELPVDPVQYMKEHFDCDLEGKTNTSWCNTRTLFEKSGKKNKYRVYLTDCQVSHGTVTGIRIMNAVDLLPVKEQREITITFFTGHIVSYIATTRNVIDLLFGTLYTPEKERCKNDFAGVAISINEIINNLNG
ncbi:DUF5677 domain-containing protein [bacterium]|nr:DUF5677 domain-containing protein [bacterium]